MTEFVSVLGCLKRDTDDMNAKDEPLKNGDGEEEELDEKEEQEVEEIVEDFLAMQNKEILKRDLKRMARDNVLLRRKVARLEARVKSGPPVELAFQIDCTGEEEEEEGAEAAESSFIYDPVGLGGSTVLGSVVEEPAETTPRKPSRSSCFNCCGSHNMADCPEPRDGRRIAKNRKEFQGSACNSARFFVEGKREAITPGLPSPALREALGLRPDQLPEYIYKLREMGYPPGWMKQAEIHESGMGIYQEGEERMVEAEDKKEMADQGGKMQFDPLKLVSWPGFNSDLPKDFRDETNKYRVKSQSRCISLKEMKREMMKKAQKGYKKGKMQDVSTDNKTVTDMEVEEGECDGTIDLTESSQEDIDPPGEEGEVKDAVAGEEVVLPEPTPALIIQPVGSGVIAKTDQDGTGTPIVEMFSPFQSVPDKTNWAVNMSEHVAFENLPNYTGTWDKMTGLIKRIRDRKEEEA